MTYRTFPLEASQAYSIDADFGSPLYLYNEESIRQQCREFSKIQAPFGLTTRFAVKANPNANILRIIESEGLHFDASSEYEVQRCIQAGIPAEKIRLTSQQFIREFREEFLATDLKITACSLHQLRQLGREFPGHSVGIRVNPGIGSGANNKTNVGGPSSSFGIWHEQVDEALNIAGEYGLTIDTIHSHIGSGADSAIWEKAARLTLDIALGFCDIHTVNLGGGFKVARAENEITCDVAEVGNKVAAIYTEYAEEHGVEYKMELEPGTFIVANAGAILAKVDDLTQTGEDGYNFVKLNAGMDMLTRPALYASWHNIVPFYKEEGFGRRQFIDATICGHCCESGDMFTIDVDENLTPRPMACPDYDELVLIEGTGAYSSSMSLTHYNSFPQAAEVLIRENGDTVLIRKRSNMDYITANEVKLEL